MQWGKMISGGNFQISKRVLKVDNITYADLKLSKKYSI